MENIAVAVADNIIGKELLSEIIVSFLMDDEYSESLQLKIIQALSSGLNAQKPDEPFTTA